MNSDSRMRSGERTLWTIRHSAIPSRSLVRERRTRATRQRQRRVGKQHRVCASSRRGAATSSASSARSRAACRRHPALRASTKLPGWGEAEARVNAATACATIATHGRPVSSARTRSGERLTTQRIDGVSDRIGGVTKRQDVLTSIVPRSLPRRRRRMRSRAPDPSHRADQHLSAMRRMLRNGVRVTQMLALASGCPARSTPTLNTLVDPDASNAPADFDAILADDVENRLIVRFAREDFVAQRVSHWTSEDSAEAAVMGSTTTRASASSSCGLPFVYTLGRGRWVVEVVRSFRAVVAADRS